MSQHDSINNKNSSEMFNTKQRYCICQKNEDELYEQDDNNDFMIECDGCHGWFHGQCVSIPDRVADDIEKYFCMECSKQYGPSIFKQRRNQHRRDFSDANAEHKPIQSGTKEFINKLKRKTFLNCESIITRLKGNQLTSEYLVEDGFIKPILISNRDGLELVLPNRKITLKEINDLVGHDHYVDIIDCEKQVTYKMSLNDYVEYFESYDRNKTYNVLSLETSNTDLGDLIITPKIVRDISWATSGIWPNKKKDKKLEDNIVINKTNQLEKKKTWSSQSSLTKKKRRRFPSTTDTDQSDDDDENLNANHFENFERPEVAKYCLMSPQSSYTDFHIDFGGSSVWYSVVRGEKIFYLIEPTDENLQKYAEWSKSPNESEVFLGDCVSHCYQMHIREGNTVFIPAGWIHAVYTVTDSLVFGGNFLQSMGIDMQLRIYEFEQLAQVPHKFKYPLFETFHWYAAKSFHDELKECNNSNSFSINLLTQQASESIIYHMNRWLINDKRYQIRNRSIIPKGMNCEKLLRELARELDIAKIRCNLPSKSIMTNLTKIAFPLKNKRELTQTDENKIKVHLSSDLIRNKNKESTIEYESKLNVNTITNEIQNKNNNGNLSPILHKRKVRRQLSPIKQKKNDSKHENLPKMTYKFDLESKQVQDFIQTSNVQLFINESESTNDSIISSISGKSPIDDIKNCYNNDILSNITDDNLVSFAKNSVLDNDYYKNKQMNLGKKIPSFSK